MEHKIKANKAIYQIPPSEYLEILFAERVDNVQLYKDLFSAEAENVLLNKSNEGRSPSGKAEERKWGQTPL